MGCVLILDSRFNYYSIGHVLEDCFTRKERELKTGFSVEVNNEE
uniref:Uncharacterized protein n=1 Tax=Rhizophora mucronata TaxID=61149 RepID=A0A2P2P7V8_RHIMU